jgi:hypothetical protein
MAAACLSTCSFVHDGIAFEYARVSCKKPNTFQMASSARYSRLAAPYPFLATVASRPIPACHFATSAIENPSLSPESRTNCCSSP